MSIADIVGLKNLSHREATYAWKAIEKRSNSMEADWRDQAEALTEFDERRGWQALGSPSFKAYLKHQRGIEVRQVQNILNARRAQLAYLETDVPVEPEGRKMSLRAGCLLAKMPDERMVPTILEAHEESFDQGHVGVINEPCVQAAIKKLWDREPAKDKAPTSSPSGPEVAEVVRDALGVDVTEEPALSAFNDRPRLASTLVDLTSVGNILEKMSASPAGALLKIGSINVGINAVKTLVRSSLPHAVHVDCYGRGCEECEGRGWKTLKEHEQGDAP